MDAPLQPPVMDQPEKPAYRLYKLSAIAVAGFLGGPIGGAWVVASNYRRTGDRKGARNAWIIGIASTIGLLVLSFLLPTSVPRTPFAVAIPLAIYYGAKPLMAPVINAHQRRGGGMRSSWMAVPIGLGCTVAMLAVVFGVVLAADFWRPSIPGTHVAFSNKEEVIYSGGATEADARALGEGLKQLGLFDGKVQKSVFLERTPDGAVVVSVITANATSDQEKEQVERLVRSLGAALRPLYPGMIFSIRMLDKKLEVKGTFRVQ